MIREFFHVTLWALIIWAAGQLVLAVSADAGDYTVTRGTVIQSQRPFWLLVTEAGLGVISGNGSITAVGDSSPSTTSSTTDFVRSLRESSLTLQIDGRPAPGIGGMVRAGWRLLGFVLWDEAGRIERVTTLSVRGHVVNIYDRVSNGSVRVRVTVGPPLGDPRVQYAVLELEVTDRVLHHVSVVEHGTEAKKYGIARLGRLFGPLLQIGAVQNRVFVGCEIRMSCSVVIDLPGDRCRLVRRIARRIAEREAGEETAEIVRLSSDRGRRAVVAGRERLTDSVIAEFLERVCR